MCLKKLVHKVCALIGQKTQKFSGTNQKPERSRPFGTGLVRHCPQGLLPQFFTFLRAIFSRPFRLSLAPTICPWVSEDLTGTSREANQLTTPENTITCHNAFCLSPQNFA